MKNRLRKNILIILAVSAFTFLCAAFTLFGGAVPVSADMPENWRDPHDHSAWTPLTSSGGELTSGNYYLSENVQLDENITIVENTVTICLNGYILCGNGNGSVITVNSGATLNIYDCQAQNSAEEYRHYYNVDGIGLWKFKDSEGGFLTSGEEDKCVTGGVITGGGMGETNALGGGIYVLGELNITGGTIAGNYGSSVGGIGFGGFVYTTIAGGPVVTNNFVNIDGKDVERNICCFFNDNGDKGYNRLILHRTFDASRARLGITADLNQTIVGSVNIDGDLQLSDSDIANSLISDIEYYTIRVGRFDLRMTNLHNLTLNLYKEGEDYVTYTDTATYEYGDAATALPTPEREGYDFEGWYESEDFTGEILTEIPPKTYGEKTYYAKWTHIAHSWGEGVITVNPNCTDNGERTFTCTVCGETKTEAVAVDVNAHSWGEWTESKAATCTEKGEEKRICSHNGDHTETRETAALEHSWGEWTETKPATETEEGEKSHTCSVCGATETQSIPVAPKDSNKHSLLWLIILLAVIAVLIIEMGIAVAYNRKKRKS